MTRWTRYAALILAVCVLGAPAGCRRDAKPAKAPQASPTPTATPAITPEPDGFKRIQVDDAERWLPSAERLRRRQEKLANILDAQPPAN